MTLGPREPCARDPEEKTEDDTAPASARTKARLPNPVCDNNTRSY